MYLSPRLMGGAHRPLLGESHTLTLLRHKSPLRSEEQKKGMLHKAVLATGDILQAAYLRPPGDISFLACTLDQLMHVRLTLIHVIYLS